MAKSSSPKDVSNLNLENIIDRFEVDMQGVTSYQVLENNWKLDTL